MKLTIYKETEKDDIVRLTLSQDRDGNVILKVVDKYGNSIHGGYILAITPAGIIITFPEVSDEYGFKTDSKGRVIIQK